ncbi:MAG: hypothetical protein MUC58_11645 [Rhizobiaceae bacterium]|jgi:hypothetical protein|nr:hypothetical protein [Rhizobiaceae bacterium]
MRLSQPVIGALLLGLAAAAAPLSAAALSQLQPGQPAAPDTDAPPRPPLPVIIPPIGQVPADTPIETAPLPPAPGLPAPSTDPTVIGPPSPGVPLPAPLQAATPEPAAPVAVLRDVSALPLEVQTMRSLIMEAARSGDIERLRPLFGTGDATTQVTFTDEIIADPIAFLKEQSGDGEGQEILAIILDLLETSFVLDEAGTPEALYLWPSFAVRPFDALTPAERVELFRLVTAGDYEDMKERGAWSFYQLAIAPDGRWLFFAASD